MPHPNDDQIAALEQELSELREMLKQLSGEFKSKVAELAESRWAAIVEDNVKTQTDVTKALGVERLRALKDSLKSLQAKSAEVVETKLGRDELWWHLRPGSDGYHESLYQKWEPSSRSERLPPKLGEAVGASFGAVARVLDKYGYNEGEKARGLYRGRSQYGGYGDWQTALGNDVHLSLLPILERYGTEGRKARDIMTRINSMKSQIETDEAEDLWNQA